MTSKNLADLFLACFITYEFGGNLPSGFFLLSAFNLVWASDCRQDDVVGGSKIGILSIDSQTICFCLFPGSKIH